MHLLIERLPFLNLNVDFLASKALENPYLVFRDKFSQSNIHILSLNIEQVVLAKNDLEYQNIINSAEIIIPDGAGIVLTHNYLLKSEPKLHKVAGIDLALKLLQSSKRVALLGSTQESIDILKAKFAEKIVFAHHGYFAIGQKDELIREIALVKPDLLLVAMGAPKQEKFIYECMQTLQNCICMGVGGAFDIWSEKLQRAPKWMILMNLEWFFRIIQEPSRLKRFFNSVYGYVSILISTL